MSSASIALPKPNPWGVCPTAASFRARMPCFTLAASTAALSDSCTRSSSGAPNTYTKGRSEKARRVLAAE